VKFERPNSSQRLSSNTVLQSSSSVEVENITVTPHIGSATYQSRRQMEDVLGGSWLLSVYQS
jgi:lactate dehydrogenase-like 2-hydroxyacid dehydrogenase